MNRFLERIERGPVIIADGGTGSVLIEHGLEPGAAPESMNIPHPEVLREVAAGYIEAGAELVHTNTFGASPLMLSLHGLDGMIEEIIVAAVTAALGASCNREATADPASPPDDSANPSLQLGGAADPPPPPDACVYVSGSVGPTGRTLLPYGDTDAEEIRQSFARQIEALVSAGVDVLTIETMTDLSEARLAVEEARRVSTSIPIMATMTFDVLPRGIYTIMGNDVASVVRELTDVGADVVGSNCGNGTESMLAIAREFRRWTEAPLIFQPNAGIPRMVNGRTIFDETSAHMASHAASFADLGVAVLGGCCGTTPEHIRALRDALHR